MKERLPAYIELSFAPSVSLITHVRHFVSQFYDAFLADPDATSRVGLVTHELLENATKYASDGITTLRIDLLESEAETRLTITTKNKAADRHLAILREAFAEIGESPDAMEHYRRVMRRNVKRDDISGLGLPRIRAEGEMDLTMRELDGFVHVVATTTIRSEARP